MDSILTDILADTSSVEVIVPNIEAAETSTSNLPCNQPSSTATPSPLKILSKIIFSMLKFGKTRI
jgi:hypothetical protein